MGACLGTPGSRSMFRRHNDHETMSKPPKKNLLTNKKVLFALIGKPEAFEATLPSLEYSRIGGA